ncbi:unnamed protein product [Heterobilharzia americana]|nr:unnamed protein product [Heterobilharzia americana]
MLSCTAVGAPVPSVQWFKGKQHLQREQLSKQPPGTAKLLLTDLSESLNVTCVAESTMGRIYHDVQVIVKNLPNPPGEFQLIELAATHARLAMKPSTSSVSAVRSYLILWLPNSQFTNQTLYELPSQANLLISQPSDQTEPIILSNTEEPNLIMLPKSLKNVSRSSLTNLHQHSSDLHNSEVNQQALLTIEPKDSTFLYNVIIISLTQLKPYTEYTIWARCVGPDGDTSLPSQPFTFTTRELAPSSPPLHVHSQALSNAAVTVYWDPPSEPNGRIRAYRIYYTHNPTLEFSYWDTSIVNLQALKSPSATSTTLNNGRKTNLPGHLSILSHLTTNATYYIRVSAVNGQGEGPASDVSVVIVRPGVLSRPQNFNATTKSSYEVMLQWQPPSDVDPNSRPLEYYELNYTPVPELKTPDHLNTWFSQTQSKDQVIEPAKRIRSEAISYLVDNLEPNTRYLFNLVAVSKTGPGVKATTFARTSQFIPPAPTNLSVQAVSANRLQVKWQRPIINGPPSVVISTRIAYYDLNWRQSDSEGLWLRTDSVSSNSLPSWSNQPGNSGVYEANTFGSLQVPVHRSGYDSSENYTDSLNTWYTANITGLQPSTYYVIHVSAVSPSGSGDKAISRPVKTWDEPPSAPQKLYLTSQIIPPQLDTNLPPKVLIRVSWEPVWLDSRSSTVDKSTIYRIRWYLTKMKFLHGEVNLTETTWNAPSDIFLLGMSYEFRVAVITPLQIGYEAVETIALDGTAPTNSPTSIQVSYSMDQVILSWNPPDWDHRHGLFEAYEIKCYSTKLSTHDDDDDDAIHTLSESYTNSYHQHQYINITLLNSRIQWPITAPNDLTNIVPWPSGQLRLNIPNKYRGEIDSTIDKHKNSHKNKSNDEIIYACIIRARNIYGFGPWSTEKIMIPKKPSIPPPPKNIRGLFLTKNQLRISWSLPSDMIQTISPNLIRRLTEKELEAMITYSGNSYSRFAVYISPKLKTNWKRYVTKGPTTEIILDDYNEEITYLVRVSSIGVNEQESKWSEPVSTQRIKLSQSNLAVKVYNVNCRLFYRSQTNLWQLQVKWEVPKHLQISPYFDQLSHYRINYTLIGSVSKYESVDSSSSRELSLKRLEFHRHQFLLYQWLYTSMSNSIYAVSIRPVFKGASKLDTDVYITEPYGIVENTFCYVPKNGILHVPVPLILSNPLIDKSAYFLIGLKSVQWIVSTSYNTSIIYELLAYKLPIPNNINNVEQIRLGQWNSSQLFHQSTDKQVHIELSQSIHDTSLRYEKRSTKLLIGKALPKHQDFALCTRVCFQPSKQFYSFHMMDSGTWRQEPICYESEWIQPVSTNRPSLPVSQLNNSINQLNNVEIYDPDKFLWSTNSFGTHSPPPSDDATAQGPVRDINIVSNRYDNHQLYNRNQLSYEKIQQLSNNINQLHHVNDDNDDDKSSLNKVHITSHLSHNSQITLLTSVKWINKNQLSSIKKLKNRYYINYNILNRLNFNQYKNNRKLFNLNEIHSPPPDSNSITANLHSNLTSYSSPTNCLPISSIYEYSSYHNHNNNNNNNPTINTTLLYSPSNNEMRNFINPLHTINDIDHFDNLQNEINPNYTSESPNTTLCITTTTTTSKLNCIDTISLNNHLYQLNSPSSSLSSNIVYQSNYLISNGIGGLGSLKSVSTIGLKSLQPIHPNGSVNLDYSGLVSPVSTQHSKHIINSIPNRSQIFKPIPISSLIEHVQNLKVDNGRLMAAEFESIDPGGPFTWEHSNRPGNRNKNRYANVVAYDHSRVVLQLNANNEPDSDYINANYLDGYCKQNAYIATQGPLPHTISDFWRMVWEQRSAMIVSMTRLEEKARVKLNFRTSANLKESIDEHDVDTLINGDLIFTNELSYISQSTMNFGDISVSLLDTMELAYYTVRSFVLQKAGMSETREVRQLQFTAWPDHGVPNHPAPLLMFLRRVRAECPTDSGPIVVHCSAGVGRTGAFILLDILLEQMRHEKAVDVFSAVSRLRAQRNFMVQTEDQYAFIYEALVEAASSGNTEIPVHQLGAHWTRLTDLNRMKCQDQQLTINQLNLSVKSSIYTNSTISTGLELEFYHLLTQSNLTKVISSIPSSIGLLSPIDPFSIKDDERGNNGCSSIPRLPPPVGLSGNKAATAATLPVNASKNRHINIIPHDANRVALKAVRGVDGSDYINASYIDAYKSRAGYIATQVPMINTLEDFWRMIWESGSCLIVKLDSTLNIINDVKFIDSPTYWPNLQSARHGFLVIDPIATYTMPAYIMRELRLTDTRDGSTRTVRQFDASSTADAIIHLERQTYASNDSSKSMITDSLRRDFNEFLEASSSVVTPTPTTLLPNPLLLEASFTEDDYLRVNQIPSSLMTTFRQCYQPLCEAMLELISQVHKTKEHFGMDGPITVHCNFGAGMTGVFLAISLVLERMRYEGVVDMFQTVKLLRWQRPGLIQTASEYAFCYATALEYLESFERYAT